MSIMGACFCHGRLVSVTGGLCLSQAPVSVSVSV